MGTLAQMVPKAYCREPRQRIAREMVGRSMGLALSLSSASLSTNRMLWFQVAEALAAMLEVAVALVWGRPPEALEVSVATSVKVVDLAEVEVALAVVAEVEECLVELEALPEEAAVYGKDCTEPTARWL